MMDFFKLTHEIEDIFGDEEYYHRTLEGAKANADERLTLMFDMKTEDIPQWTEVPEGKHVVWERTMETVFQRIESLVIQN